MTKKKIVSWRRLRGLLQRARRERKKIVFTNGCFDLIHVGHLEVFEKCKGWGDLLVVGLNSDRSVRKLKGRGRPLMPERDRAVLLAGFQPVDYVTIFDQQTPAKLIRLVRPDVLAKGGDWPTHEIVGREAAKAVRRVPLIRGRSTTELIRRIVRRYGRYNHKEERRGWAEL